MMLSCSRKGEFCSNEFLSFYTQSIRPSVPPLFPLSYLLSYFLTFLLSFLLFREICVSRPDLLSQLEASSPLANLVTRYGGRVGPILEDSPSSSSSSFSSDTGSLPRVSHLAPMLSLENAMDVPEVEKWLERMFKLTNETEPLPVLAEPKLDGLALSLRYEVREIATREVPPLCHDAGFPTNVCARPNAAFVFWLHRRHVCVHPRPSCDPRGRSERGGRNTGGLQDTER